MSMNVLVHPGDLMSHLSTVHTTTTTTTDFCFFFKEPLKCTCKLLQINFDGDSQRCIPKCSTVFEKVVTSWQSTGNGQIILSVRSGLWGSVTINAVSQWYHRTQSYLSFSKFSPLKEGGFSPFLSTRIPNETQCGRQAITFPDYLYLIHNTSKNESLILTGRKWNSSFDLSFPNLWLN